MIKSIAAMFSMIIYTNAFAGLVSYLDVQVDNETEFTLTNVNRTEGSKGSLGYLNSDNIPAGDSIKIANFSANYLGQLSQNLSFNVNENGQDLGTCKLHVGVGSYLAMPDFSGSECNINSSEYVQLSPRFEISGNTYKTHFRLSRSKHFSRIFAFGDSMSDNGNLYKRSVEISLVFPISPILPSSPPYYSGRFTNGKVWIEKLSDKMNIPEGSFIDYAYAGATVVSDLYPIPTLDKQVTTYLNWNKMADPYALYTVWIGANDLIRHFNQADDDLVNEISEGVESNIKRLIDHGAKNILSLPIPDLTITPDTLGADSSHGNTRYSERLNVLINKYNKKHKDFIAKLQQEHPDVKMMTFDVYSFIQVAKLRAKEYGFTNITDRCNPNDYWKNEREVCDNPNEYVYWDGIHPSANAHSILADLMFKFLTEGAGFEPNLKSLVKHTQMDDVAMRNKVAIEQLNKDIDSPAVSQGSYDSQKSFSGIGWTNDLSSLIRDGVPLY